jgi:hypothetical protein
VEADLACTHGGLQREAGCGGNARHGCAWAEWAARSYLTLPSPQAGEVDILLTAFALAWRNEVISRGGAAEAYPAADLVLIFICFQHV